DTIILNSVVQYFPDVEYLQDVLEGALRLLTPGGHVFIGDIRSLPLLEVFHSLVEVEQAAPLFSREYIRERVRQAMRNEEELLLDPALFTHLPQFYSALKQVRVIPKRGRYLNELSQFRYQVVLRTEEPGEVIPSLDCTWLDRRESAMSLSRLHHLLKEEAPPMLGLASVPNARLAAALCIHQFLTGKNESYDAEPNAAALREIARTAASDGLEPEDLWGLADELPYDIAISWARHQRDGSYDVLLQRREGDSVREPALQLAQAFPTSKDVRPTWRNYANWPGGGSRLHALLLQLRPYLQEKLPEYMVPSSFLLLDQLPLTPNGKVDRRSLPAPEGHAGSAESYVAPRTPVEELLTAIWVEVLGLEHIGVHDNFFDLGGHSLLATQVIVRVRETFRQEVPLRTLFEHPTVQGLAETLEALQRRQWGVPSYVSVPPLQHKPYPAELPLSFAQERLWFLAQLEPEAPFYTIAAAFRLTGPLYVWELEKSLQALVSRHESLRTRFIAREGCPIQIIDPRLTLPLPITDLTGLAPSAGENLMRSLVRAEVGSPFNLTAGPLLHVRLLRLGAGEHGLLLSMHHLIADGWSLGVFFRELSAFYDSFTARLAVSSHQRHIAPQLPELRLQYADYTLWQNEWLSGAVLQEQLAYWKRQLANLEPLALPTDMPRPARQRFRGSYKRFQFDADLITQLKHLSRREGVTLFMTLLTGFQILLARYSGQHDIAVGTPIANRVRSELEGLIGLFVNTLVLRGNLSGNP